MKVPEALPETGSRTDSRILLQVLKSELEFLERGGYTSGHAPWRPAFVFEDSPSCPNFSGRGERVPCEKCVLMQLVPPEHREKPLPCRYIPLKTTGETVDYYYKCGTQAELETALRAWLVRMIARLEAEAAAA